MRLDLKNTGQIFEGNEVRFFNSKLVKFHFTENELLQGHNICTKHMKYYLKLPQKLWFLLLFKSFILQKHGKKTKYLK